MNRPVEYTPPGRSPFSIPEIWLLVAREIFAEKFSDLLRCECVADRYFASLSRPEDCRSPKQGNYSCGEWPETFRGGLDRSSPRYGRSRHRSRCFIKKGHEFERRRALMRVDIDSAAQHLVERESGSSVEEWRKIHTRRRKPDDEFVKHDTQREDVGFGGRNVSTRVRHRG